MATSDPLPPLPPPDDRMWSMLGVVRGRELYGGHQSRVFAGVWGGDRVVVKLTDSRLADPAYERRVHLTARLAELDDSVVGPLTTEHGVVVALGQWLAVLYPFVTGRTPDVREEADVRAMAATMAHLHDALRQLDVVDVPAVAALAGTGTPIEVGRHGPHQLLHGDFSPANLLESDGRLRVFDFDDCGYGPIEFDVGNTLYMALFDAATSGTPEHSERFRAWFVDEYRSASGRRTPDDLLDSAISLRVATLARWIDLPESAPIGIRTAPPAWLDTLRAFVRSQTDR